MATPQVLMRAFASTIAFGLLFATPVAASRHEIKLQVLTTLSQNVRGVGIAPGIEVVGAPVSCSPPYPDNTVSVQQKVPGYDSADQCTLALPSHDVSGTVHNREVQALLTTEDGLQYYVILGCERQFGWCDALGNKEIYSGQLNDSPKWLANYQTSASDVVHENIISAWWEEESDLQDRVRGEGGIGEGHTCPRELSLSSSVRSLAASFAK